MRINYVLATGLAGLVMLAGCSLPKDSAMQAQADAMKPCEKIDALVAAHDKHFDGIKGPVLSQRYLDVWAAKVDAIGEGCQIWKSGEHTTYMCTRNAPNEALAREWFDQAAKQMGQCLSGWKQQAANPEIEQAKGLVWINKAKFASVGLQLVPVGRNHWTVYYFIGDRDRWF